MKVTPTTILYPLESNVTVTVDLCPHWNTSMEDGRYICVNCGSDQTNKPRYP